MVALHHLFSPLQSLHSSRFQIRRPEQTSNAITRRQFVGGLQAAAAFSLSPLGLNALALSEIDPRLVLFDTAYHPSHDAGETWKCMPLIAQLPADMHQWGRDSKSSNKEERPRFFDSKAKRTCWDKAKTLPGRDPERWRIDAAGNIVCKRLHTCNGCLCYEYDHITPFSKGGESVAENCQILQTRVNRLKSDKNGIDQELLEGYSCDIKFSDEQLDLIEMAVYGSVIRPGRQCIVGSMNSLIGKYSSGGRTITCNSTQK